MKQWTYTITAKVTSSDLAAITREYIESVKIAGYDNRDDMVSVIMVTPLIEVEDGPQHEHLKGQDDD